MKINIIKPHSYYNRFGEHDVEEGRGNYLISIGVAEKVQDSPEGEAEAANPDVSEPATEIVDSPKNDSAADKPKKDKAASKNGIPAKNIK